MKQRVDSGIAQVSERRHGLRTLALAFGLSCQLAFVGAYANGNGNGLATTLADTQHELIQAARLAETSGDVASAAEHYKRFLVEHADSPLKSRIMTRVSVLHEAQRFGVDHALTLYLQALDAREARDVALAETILEKLEKEFPSSYLNDDALYLRGYIAMMDAYQYEKASDLFRELRRNYPDSSYMDTVLYSEAICLEQLGKTESANLRFEELRERHTEFSLSLFGVRWPKSTYLSRYWYDRADKRLNMVHERQQSAARMVSRSTPDSTRDATDFDLRVEVAVEGRRIPLLLSASTLVRDTHFDSEAELTLALSDARYYSGQVEGDAHSWARVMIRGREIEGVIETGGERIDLEPASMVGTLEYYKPDDGKPGSIEELRLQDYVMQPPPDPNASFNQALQNRKAQLDKEAEAEPALGAATAAGVSRLVRMSVFVDSQYNAYYGGDGLLQAMSALNVADGIYRKNFGLAIEVGSATVFTNLQTDPMNLGAVTLEKTLRTFRDFHLNTRDEADDIALSYLFSGNNNVDEAIGLAWIGAICRNDGFDVGVTTPSSYADLLVTHELGHSLGAQHDSDTSCSGRRNLLMWPRISGSTTQSFSDCSQDSVHQGIAKSCLLNTIDVSLDVRHTSDNSVVASLTNNDVSGVAQRVNLVIEAAAVDLNELPGGCIENSPAELVCSVDRLSPGETVEFDFLFGAQSSPDSSFVAWIEPGDYYDVVALNDQVTLALNADGALVAASMPDNSREVTIAGNAVASGNDSDAAVSGSVGNTEGGAGSSDWWLLAGGLISGFWMRALGANQDTDSDSAAAGLPGVQDSKLLP